MGYLITNGKLKFTFGIRQDFDKEILAICGFRYEGYSSTADNSVYHSMRYTLLPEIAIFRYAKSYAMTLWSQNVAYSSKYIGKSKIDI
jgi:hypothetical protein